MTRIRDDLALLPEHKSVECTDATFCESAGVLRTTVLAPKSMQNALLEVAVLRDIHGWSTTRCAEHFARKNPSLPPLTHRFLARLCGDGALAWRGGRRTVADLRGRLRFWRSVPAAARATPISVVVVSRGVPLAPPPPWRHACSTLHHVLLGDPPRCILQDRVDVD
jgi:hypothetical protein